MELSSVVKDLRAASDTLLQPDPELSENEIFGKYVTKCLDKLAPLESALAQQEIQSILTKYKISLLRNQNKPDIQSPSHSVSDCSGVSTVYVLEGNQQEQFFPLSNMDQFINNNQ